LERRLKNRAGGSQSWLATGDISLADLAVWGVVETTAIKYYLLVRAG
jgi:hypothetical protein